MDTLIATHRIQRGLSRVSIRKRKPTEMSKLEQLQLKGRDLQQDLKDKHFQLRCIEQLLDQDITNDVSDELYWILYCIPTDNEFRAYSTGAKIMENLSG